jgi:hypothetical protein
MELKHLLNQDFQPVAPLFSGSRLALGVDTKQIVNRPGSGPSAVRREQ